MLPSCRFQLDKGLRSVQSYSRTNSVARVRTVLVVAHAWHEDLYGGAFRIATELALGLAANGQHVTYLCCNVGNAPDREVIRGVEVRRYRTRPPSMFAPRFWQHLLSAKSLARQIAAEYDISAVSGHSPLQYLAVLQTLNSTDRPRCTYVVHSPFAEEQLAAAGPHRVNWKLRLRATVGSFIDGWCLRGSDVVQCLSRFTVELLCRRYGESIRKCCSESPGWVDTERFQPATDRRLHRAELPAEWHTDDPILLTVRRLESRMGLDTLIEAAALLADTHPFRILIGGSGPLAAHLMDAIKRYGLEDRVFLLGRIPEEQLPACYSAADAFILPSRSLECFGLIALEAFAAGTPVIGARVGAIPELLAQIGDEWMFEAGDAEGLARCLRNFLDGQLATAVDLREIALRYDICVLLPRWIELCLGPNAEQDAQLHSNG